MLELTRQPEGGRCRRCRGWFLLRHGFGQDKRWCTRLCWLASPQRRLVRKLSPRTFQSGSCTVCGALFTILVGNHSEAQGTGGRFCSEACHRRRKRHQHRANQRARVCPGCLIRPPACGRGLARIIGILCPACQKLAIYACLSKTRFADKDSARDQSHGQRVYPCLLCGGWHRSSTVRSMTSGSSDVMRRLAPFYDRLVLEPQIKAMLIYIWRLRRGAGAGA